MTDFERNVWANVEAEAERRRRQDEDARYIAAQQAKQRDEAAARFVRYQQVVREAGTMLMRHGIIPRPVWESRHTGTLEREYDSPRGGGVNVFKYYDYTQIGQGWLVYIVHPRPEYGHPDFPTQVGIDSATLEPVTYGNRRNSGQRVTGGPVLVEGLFDPLPRTTAEHDDFPCLEKGVAALLTGDKPYHYHI
jgi:hypothetical protein